MITLMHLTTQSMSPDGGGGSDSADSKPGKDVGQAEVQATVDKEEEKGYRGYTEDKADYTVLDGNAGIPDEADKTKGPDKDEK